MDISKKALNMHEKWQGKIEITAKARIKDKEDLSIAYTPGVAEPCKEIHKDRNLVYKYTGKKNLIAVISDGTAVLGLGDIGPYAGYPVMEGKAVLFKEFAGVNAVPIMIDEKDPDKIIEIIKAIAPTFGGINLEDIKAPKCFYIEERLKKELDIPVFHDDQHGTAIVVLAALLNAIKLADKDKSLKIVINGAGSAGSAICKLLVYAGFSNIVTCDTFGAICKEDSSLLPHHMELAMITNKNNEQGPLEEIIKGADVFIGVSAPNIVSIDMVKSMNEKSIVFAMANPVPEISYEDCVKAGVYIIGTGRSDYNNQINNVLAFPGIFKGALLVNATQINEEMKIAAAYAIADLVAEDELKEDYIIPSVFDNRVAGAVSDAVIKTAISTGDYVKI